MVRSTMQSTPPSSSTTTPKTRAFRRPVADGRWRYYSFSELGTDERTYFIGRCIDTEDGEWPGLYPRRRALCALYEDQDGWLCLCFEPEGGRVRGEDYVWVCSTYTLWAESRAGLLDTYWGIYGDDSPEIPRLIASVPEVETMHEIADYDA
jgi:hypothetical protein